jgi:multicomponent Na+:H+ antiporter subunit A
MDLSEEDGREARLPAYLATGLAVAGFLALAWAWREGGGTIDLPWAPTLDLRLHFELDGLGALYGMLATGVGAAVFLYSSRYLPRHLAAKGRPGRDSWRFHALLVVFMVSMVGLATAQDMILLFVFWDLTAITSYFLIGYDRGETDSRKAALMAMLITGISAVCLLIGALMLHERYGTFQLPELFDLAEANRTVTVAAALVAIAGLAKSAQAPFQFWLPRAMVAPTPVSAYLHSAAMVAAGVFLLSRFYPLIELDLVLRDALLVLGVVSMAVGGVLALAADDLKRLLAYSTISQYGYVVTMLGLGGEAGALAASFYVIAHALPKCALFMTAGAVIHATGEKGLSGVGGLARPMPWLAAGGAVSAATIAALPLTLGFFKDELFFKAALERGDPFAVIAVAGAGLTFAYMGRFWIGVFLGPLRAEPARLPALMTLPVLVLGAGALAGGIVVGPFERLAEAAGEATVLRETPGAAAYHLDLRTENVMAIAAWAVGAFLLLSQALWRPLALGASRLGERLGPERGYVVGLRGLNALSDAIHDFEVRDLRTRIAAVLVPGGVLVAIGLIATPTTETYGLGTFTSEDLPLALALFVTGGAALAASFPRRPIMLVLALGAAGFALATVYAFFGGPDVALVAVLVETILALLFLGVLALLPPEVRRRKAAPKVGRARERRDRIVGVVSGAAAFVVVWGALSRPTPERSIAFEHLERTEDAHAKDTVTAILADFRGLDTLVEITVVFVALLGLATLLRGGRMP